MSELINSSTEDFKQIIDPETNKLVPVQSAIGTQIIKNYLECIKNGPESKNIISTRMFYKKKTQPSSSKGGSLVTKSKTELSVYDMAKKLSNEQVDQNKINNKNNVKSIKKGSKIWVQRSNGKWQRALVYEAYKKNNEYFVNAYLNAGNNRIGSKKNLSLKSIILG